MVSKPLEISSVKRCSTTHPDRTLTVTIPPDQTENTPRQAGTRLRCLAYLLVCAADKTAKAIYIYLVAIKLSTY